MSETASWDAYLTRMQAAVISDAADILKMMGRHDEGAKAAYESLAKWMRLGRRMRMSKRLQIAIDCIDKSDPNVKERGDAIQIMKDLQLDLVMLEQDLKERVLA